MIIPLIALRHSPGHRQAWHRRLVILRMVTIGGPGTTETAQRSFVIAARLWARRSTRQQRWLFARAPQTTPQREVSLWRI